MKQNDNIDVVILGQGTLLVSIGILLGQGTLLVSIAVCALV